jgi:transcriptional regulator with PAS, ATPase and Fis domain
MVPPTPADVSVRRVHADPTRWSRIRYTLDDLVGTDQAMHHVRKLARACARTDLPVLLLGESGTGKEVLAQAIHAASPRRERAFVAVNCAALPRELMESELFGHAAGAFTGARRDGQIGKFQAADGGTLFLDEIAELSAGAQAALLRVLQEGEVTRLGEHAARAFDVRIIAATNRDVQQAVAQGRLRDDLFHRLDVLSMTLPPLRERRGDIAALVQRFLADAPQGDECTLTPDAMQALEHYRWPGNVRELRNVIQRLVTLADTPVIDVHDLPTTVRAARGPSALVAVAPPMPAAHHVADEGQAVASGQQDAEQLARRRLSDAIANHATIAEAAASLGITRSTLYRRLQRYGLTSGRAVREAPVNARATR